MRPSRTHVNAAAKFQTAQKKLTGTMPALQTNPLKATTKHSLPEYSRPDAPLALCVAALLLFGAIMTQSASQYIDPLDPMLIARKEILWDAIGATALGVTAFTDYQIWKRIAIPLFIAAILLSAAALVMGHASFGAQRWISLGSFITFQPSEFAKLAFIIYGAKFIDERSDIRTFKDIWPVLLTGFVLIALVLLQNDLGTAIIIFAIMMTMLLMSGIKLELLLVPILGAASSVAAIIALSPFRRARILGFMRPLDCYSSASYQICQALIALGSGGIFGRGLGQSLQKTGYLPAPYTDSIIAVIGEELGLIGVCAVIAALAFVVWRGIALSRNAADTFGSIFAAGAAAWLGTQALLNIGSNVAALPYTGVPLPFISYGGASLTASMAAIGVLLNISMYKRQTK